MDRYDYEGNLESSDTQPAKYQIIELELRGYVPGDRSAVTNPRSGKLISSVNPQMSAYPAVVEFESEIPLDVTWRIKFGKAVYYGTQVYTSFDINSVWGDRVSQILLGRPVVAEEEAVLRGGNNVTNPEHDLLTRSLFQELEGVDDTRVTDGADDVPSTVFHPRLIPYDDYWLESEPPAERADRFIRINGITLYDDSLGQMEELRYSGFEMLWEDPSLIGTPRYEMTQDVRMVPLETFQHKAGDVLESGVIMSEDGPLIHGVMVRDVMSSTAPTHLSLWSEYADIGRLYRVHLTSEPIPIPGWNVEFDQYEKNDILVTFALRLGQYEDVG
jgi:hypothetical protein